jgi:hypothetical protein
MLSRGTSASWCSFELMKAATAMERITARSEIFIFNYV